MYVGVATVKPSQIQPEQNEKAKLTNSPKPFENVVAKVAGPNYHSWVLAP